MKYNIDIELGSDGVYIHVPFNVLNAILKPRVEFAQAYRFTEREKEAAFGIRRGLGNKQIAAELNITERTVKAHVTNLLAKTGTKTRFDLRAKLEGVPLNGNGNGA